jgi:hypothetical protein
MTIQIVVTKRYSLVCDACGDESLDVNLEADEDNTIENVMDERGWKFAQHGTKHIGPRCLGTYNEVSKMLLV